MQRAIKLLGVSAKMNTYSFEGQVLIKAKENSVLFISNNGNSGISCEFPAKVSEEGQVYVVYSRIKSFIMTFTPWNGDFGAKEFLVKKSKTKVLISVESIQNGKSSKSSINIEQINSTTNLPLVKMEEPNIIINSRIIKTAVDKLLYAVDSSGIEDFMMGIRLLVTDNEIVFTSTNGRVVSEYITNASTNGPKGEYFLPYEFIMGMKRVILDDFELFIEVSKYKTKLHFDNIVFWSSGISYRTWPDTNSVWSMFENEVIIDRDTILSGISSFVDLLDQEDYNRLTLEIKDNMLNVKTDSSLFEYEGFESNKDFIVDLDGKDLINALLSVEDTNIKLKYTDENTGVIVVSENEKQKSFVTNLSRR
jgi:DNA polymerase III sliding clamp (beta) subunit (PCNA family)